MADIKGYIPGLGQGVNIGSSDVNPNLVQYASVVVTSAQMITLNTTPVSILPAAGTNFGYVVTDAAIDVSSGTAYTSGATVGFFYGAGTTTLLIGSIPASLFTGSTTGTSAYFGSPTTVQIISNQPINLGMQTTTAFATGTETVTVNLWYTQIPLGH